MENKQTRKTVNVAVHEERDSGPEDKKPELHTYAQEILTDVEYRQQFKVTTRERGCLSQTYFPSLLQVTETAGEGEELVDLTPNSLSQDPFIDKFLNFGVHMKHEMTMMPMMHSRSMVSRSRTRQSVRGGIGGQKQSIDELIAGVSLEFDLDYISSTKSLPATTDYARANHVRSACDGSRRGAGASGSAV